MNGASRSWNETVNTFPADAYTPTTRASTSTFDQLVRVLEDDDSDEDEALFLHGFFQLVFA
jgi:hypothetical protein